MARTPANPSTTCRSRDSRHATDIARAAGIAAPARLVVRIAGGEVAVFHGEGAAHAIADGCLRCGSTLAAGVIERGSVVCPTCGWRYDLASGGVEGLAALRLDTYPVRIVEA